VRGDALAAVFVALLAGAAAFVWGTSGKLPDRVATHFGPDGRADAFMTRDAHRVFTLGFIVGIPLLVVTMVGVLPRWTSRFTNIPHRRHWFAPERRDDTLVFLTEHALRVGCLLVALQVGVHWLVLQANTDAPPRLALVPFLVLLGGFVAGIVWWIASLRARFRVSP
jgi:hypothetical protein